MSWHIFLTQSFGQKQRNKTNYQMYIFQEYSFHDIFLKFDLLHTSQFSFSVKTQGELVKMKGGVSINNHQSV